MPLRKTIFANGHFYHVLNRSLYQQPIFTGERECSRAVKLINFYSFVNRPTSFSKYLKFSQQRRQKVMRQLLEEDEKRVRIICYCFMPNHFHILVRQEETNGIRRFMSDFQNSFVRYYNTKHKKKGPLFESQFKAVRILSENQLYHVSRYIHLNPYSGFVVKSIEDLKSFPWSSLPEYLNLNDINLCYKNIVTSGFGSYKDYEEFVFSRADYQRDLEQIKHLILE